MKKHFFLTALSILLLYASTSFGQFQMVFTVPNYNNVYSMASNQFFVFAGTGGSGIYRSSDNGYTWNSINNGIPGWYYFSLLSSNDTLFAGSFGYVYFSTNNGNSWTDLNTGLGLNDDVNALARNGQYLYAGIVQKGVYYHLLGSSTWNQSIAGFHNSPTVNDLLVIGSDIYAATDSGLYKSTNNAGSWNLLNNGLPSIICANKLIYDTNNNIILAGTNNGIFKSSDYGNSWSISNFGITGTAYIRCFAAINDTIFAGTNDNLFATTNQGSNWFPFNNGLPSYGVDPLVSFNHMLFAGTGSSIYRYRSLLTHVDFNKPVSVNISVYPNPCTEELKIEIPEEITVSSVSLYDNMGRKIIEIALIEKSVVINMNSFERGIYFLRMECSDSSPIIKIFKN